MKAILFIQDFLYLFLHLRTPTSDSVAENVTPNMIVSLFYPLSVGWTNSTYSKFKQTSV